VCVCVLILDINIVLFNPYVKRMSSFSNVTFTTRALYFVNPFVLVVVQSVFNKSCFCLMVTKGLKEVVISFFLRALANPICDPFDVGKVSYFAGVMMVSGMWLTSSLSMDFLNALLMSLFMYPMLLKTLVRCLFSCSRCSSLEILIALMARVFRTTIL
jgi:hypothetical protein